MPRYTDEQIEDAVNNSDSVFGVLRHLGITKSGGSHTHITSRIHKAGIDISHYKGNRHNAGKILHGKRKSHKDILVKRSYGYRAKSHHLRRALVEVGVPYECVHCGNEGLWLDKKITLHVDHRDENWLDDRENNLRFLCPNCHSVQSRINRGK